MNAKYWDIRTLSVEDERVPCETRVEFAGLGPLDPTCMDEDLPEASKVRQVAFWLAEKVFEFVLLMLYQPDIAFDFTGGSPTLARTEIEELALHWTAQTLQRTISGGFTSGASGKESKRAKSSLFLGR